MILKNFKVGNINDAKKKGQLILVQKKKQGLRRVVECLFLSKAGPKSGCLSYLIAIIRKQTSDMCKLALISVRYDKHPLFGPAFIKIKHSTTRPKQGSFFGTKISSPFFLVIWL